MFPGQGHGQTDEVHYSNLNNALHLVSLSSALNYFCTTSTNAKHAVSTKNYECSYVGLCNVFDLHYLWVNLNIYFLAHCTDLHIMQESLSLCLTAPSQKLTNHLPLRKMSMTSGRGMVSSQAERRRQTNFHWFFLRLMSLEPYTSAMP